MVFFTYQTSGMQNAIGMGLWGLQKPTTFAP